VQRSQDQLPTSCVLWNLTPRALKRFKATAEHTILEERRLVIDGVMSDYPVIWDMIKFHGFERFTRRQPPYVMAWVRDFYATYKKPLQKKKKKGIIWKPLEEVKVGGKIVQCQAWRINEIFGTKGTSNAYFTLRINKELEELKGWLDPLISDISSP